MHNWHHPSKPIMQGNYCTLELLDINKHSNDLYTALMVNNTLESWTYLPYGPFDTCEQFQSWLKEKLAETDTLLYAILDIKTLTPIGICGYLRMTPKHGVIEVGHLHFSPLLKQTPAATEAMYLMMHYAMEELKYRRYEWKCDAANQASYNAALRLGFKHEGTFRQHMVVKNKNRDTAWFSILDSEWPAIKNRLEKWLQPNNFDEQGKQKLKLREC